KFEDGNVISVGISNANGSFSFSKGSDDKWTGTFKSKPITGFDPEKVKDMLRSYKALNADDFADPEKGPSDTGLDKPAVVAFKMKDEGGVIKLNVGKEITGKGRYAQKEESPTVFVLSTFVSDWAVAAESKFQKPEAIKDGGAGASGKGDAGVKKHP